VEKSYQRIPIIIIEKSGWICQCRYGISRSKAKIKKKHLLYLHLKVKINNMRNFGKINKIFDFENEMCIITFLNQMKMKNKNFLTCSQSNLVNFFNYTKIE